MFKDQDSAAIVAVRDLDRAKAFYGQTLGLELNPGSMGDVAVYKTGKTRLGVYVSDFAGTNQANPQP